MPQLDFASALYLGIRHGSRDLPDWSQLTSGVPAAFAEHPIAGEVGYSVARLQGLAAGVTAPSTLHLFWDLLGQLPVSGLQLFVDRDVYQVARWGIERAEARGIPISFFHHQSAASLAHALLQSSSRVPVVISDGWCPLCSRIAPLREYVRLVAPRKGWLLIDDTQALGILGASPTLSSPWGEGGGGSLPFLGLRYPRTITISSLAKAFGVPLAVLSGPAAVVRSFCRSSETRIYASPPPAVAFAAAQAALRINQDEGSQRRAALLRNTRTLTKVLRSVGLDVPRTLFPVCPIRLAGRGRTRRLGRFLSRRGIRAVPVAAHAASPEALCFLIRSDHSANDIYRLADSVQAFLSADGYRLTLKSERL